MSNMDVLNYYGIPQKKGKIVLTVLLPNGKQKNVIVESLEISRRLHIVLDQAEIFGPMDEELFTDYYLGFKCKRVLL